MVVSFFGDLLSQPHKKHAVPKGQRLYAIGDIHGRLDLLDQLLQKIDHDMEGAGDKTHQVIFLGDYVDRGSDSAGVIDRLLELRASPLNIIFLKGNHEECLLKFMDEPEDMIHWLDWGGDETLKSYGVEGVSVRDPHDLAEDFKRNMPPSHYGFLQDLKIHYEMEDFIFVHAGLKPGTPLDEQTEHDQLWIRDSFHKAKKHQRPEKTVIHGHAASKKIIDQGWRVCVDTGAVWSGVLTAVVLEGNERRFIATDGE